MPRSIFLGRPWPKPGEPLFLPEDTAVALALDELEAVEKAEQCPLCGLPKSVCRSQDNQRKFAVSREQCHATWAIGEARAAKADRMDEVTAQATQWTARLDD